ncbi:MAG: hypothetical protein RJA81_1721, partial [Planctomycetota bacterium]
MTQNQTVYQPRAFPVADAPSRIAVCISGSGTTLANLLQKMDEGKLPGIEIVCVIADRPQATGLEVAGQRGISTHVISRKDENMSQHIFDIVRHAKADLVVLGGFLSLLFVPDDYENRVINIHPS